MTELPGNGPDAAKPGASCMTTASRRENAPFTAVGGELAPKGAVRRVAGKGNDEPGLIRNSSAGSLS